MEKIQTIFMPYDECRPLGSKNDYNSLKSNKISILSQNKIKHNNQT